MNTRKVLYLTGDGLMHGEHRMNIGHTGKKNDFTETGDGGIALPVGARIGVVFCIDCNERLEKGVGYTEEDRFDFEITEHREDEPWK